MSFDIAEHAYLPPIIPSWKVGLLAVNANPSHTDVAASGYAFPKPETVCKCPNPREAENHTAGMASITSGTDHAAGTSF